MERCIHSENSCSSQEGILNSNLERLCYLVTILLHPLN